MPMCAATAVVATTAGLHARAANVPAAVTKIESEEDDREALEEQQLSALLGLPVVAAPSASSLENEQRRDVEGAPAADAKTKDDAPKYLLVRMASAVLELLNTTLFQFVAYLSFIVIFQMLIDSMRKPHEYFFDKMITDTFVDNTFDAALNSFFNIRRVADIYEWGNRGTRRSCVRAARRLSAAAAWPRAYRPP
jgi:hypothetical protein